MQVSISAAEMFLDSGRKHAFDSFFFQQDSFEKVPSFSPDQTRGHVLVLLGCPRKLVKG